VPYYVSDNTAITAATGWAPSRSIAVVLDDIFAWLRDQRATLEPLLSSGTPAMPVSAIR
jgi:CDP-paratose 2-epimerase